MRVRKLLHSVSSESNFIDMILFLLCIDIGYPELGLPVFDPLRLQKMDIEQG